MMKKALFRCFVELTGNRIISFLLRKFTTSKLSKIINASFVKIYNINVNEMEKDLHDYESLHCLFTRKLKPGLRPVDNRANSIVSPVDGIIAETGIIDDRVSFFVKGQTYQLAELFGSTEKSNKYKGGIYIILYLSPSHYHRIHSPISGEIIDQWSLGKRSYPVNSLGLKYGKRPLSTNYRIITEMKTKGVHIAVVKVGALNVNSIHLTNQYDHLKKGEEMGYFSFGSTVILLFEKDAVSLEPIKIPSEIKQGMAIGYFQKSIHC